MDHEKLSDQIRALAALKAEKKRLSDLTKANNAEIDEQERTITSALLNMAEASGLECADDFSVTVDGRRYSVITKPYYSIPAEQRDEAFKALRSLGLESLITERVDDRSLTKVLMEIAEDAGGALPEEYEAIPTRFYEKLTISDRKIG